MIVVDASVVTNLLVNTDDSSRRTRKVLGKDPQWVAPEHWKAEVFSAVRGLYLGGKVSQDKAAGAIARIPLVGMYSVSLDRLLVRMWQLRSQISAYDSPYVALAQLRGLTLVTADARLARAASAHCRVELAP